jgi:ABC-type sugar transport system substrate-binding protein
METKTVSLHLANELNEYQQVLKEDAIVTARRVGINLECYSANDQIMLQITQIYSSIQKRPIDRTNLILVLPVRDDALNRIAQDSVKLGVGWICLNRQMTFLDALRKQYTEVPIGFIGPDQTEVGRIQGRQFKAQMVARSFMCREVPTLQRHATVLLECSKSLPELM